MATESFNTMYLFAPVTVTIDIEDEGSIVKVCHQDTDIEIEIPEDLLHCFEHETAAVRHEIVKECEREGREHERHIRQESDRGKFI